NESPGQAERKKQSHVSPSNRQRNRSNPKAICDIGKTNENSTTTQRKDGGLDISETLNKDPGFFRNSSRATSGPSHLSQLERDATGPRRNDFGYCQGLG